GSGPCTPSLSVRNRQKIHAPYSFIPRLLSIGTHGCTSGLERSQRRLASTSSATRSSIHTAVPSVSHASSLESYANCTAWKNSCAAVARRPPEPQLAPSCATEKSSSTTTY